MDRTLRINFDALDMTKYLNYGLKWWKRFRPNVGSFNACAVSKFQ